LLSVLPLSRIAVSILCAFVVATPSAGARSLAPPSGNQQGLRLLARVNQAYVHVPASALRGRAGAFAFRFTLVLRSGVIAAEQYVASGPGGTTELVRRPGAPTFAREPGSTCWRRLAASDQQALEGVGLRFPDQPHMRVQRPRRTASGWLLPVVGDGGHTVFLIDAKSMLLRSITIADGGRRIVERASALRSTPTLLTPQPRC
jgi:hypothetical protein